LDKTRRAYEKARAVLYTNPLDTDLKQNMSEKEVELAAARRKRSELEIQMNEVRKKNECLHRPPLTSSLTICRSTTTVEHYRLGCVTTSTHWDAEESVRWRNERASEILPCGVSCHVEWMRQRQDQRSCRTCWQDRK
jgi:hypothetical protein